MTRFDEALKTFADAREGEMAARVTSNQRAFATIVEVDRKRSRRVASQAAAALGVVAVGVAAAWSLSGGTLDAPPAGVPLTDASFVCGEPFTAEPFGDPSGDGVGPAEHRLMAPNTVGLARLELDPVAPTLATEEGLQAWFAVAYPADYQYATAPTGFHTFAVLVDDSGHIIAKTTLADVPSDVRQGIFEPHSCSAEPLDGTYEVHMVTQSWINDPSQVEYTWVDEGLPPGAMLTIDPDEADRRAQLASTVRQILADGGESLATVTGTAAIQFVSPCTVAEAIAAGGLAAVPALATSLPPVDATLEGAELVAPYGENVAWWQSLDSSLFFVDANGGFAGVAGVTGGSEGPDEQWSKTTFGYNGPCDEMGLPTASGTYDAYLYVPQPAFPVHEAPGALQDAGGYENVAAWVPVGRYVVP